MAKTFQCCPPPIYTAHALTRMQQRSIDAEAVELLLDFAHPSSVSGGAFSYRFDDATWAEATESLGSRARKLAKFRHAYVVENGSGVVITTAWLH